jgi:hypothetical protein
MPITNFQSVISTQTLGTADVDKLAASFDKMSGAIDEATKKANKVNDHPGFAAFAEKVKQGIENPLQAIGGAAEEGLKAFGPFGAGVAASAGIFVAAGAAAFEAAKALGEYGVQIRDVELRTGLAAKEVAQYSFAAKAVGQEVTILDRMMRGLTVAVEDNTEKGAKARGWLRQWGVDIAGLKDGTASTSEALSKVGEGLEKLPAGIVRTSAAIDIFKRAGIEAIPFLVELNQNLALFDKSGIRAPSESDVAAYNDLLKEVTALETKWAAIKRDFQMGLVMEVKVVGETFEWLYTHLGGPAAAPSDAQASSQNRLFGDIDNANRAKGRWGNVPLTGVADLNRKRMESLEDLNPAVAWTGPMNLRDAARLTQAKQYQDQIDKIHQAEVAQKEKAAADAKRADAELDAAIHGHVRALNDALKLGREADKYALGLGKTTQEGFASAYFGDLGPAGKLYAAYGKLNADEADQRTKYGGTAAWSKIAKDFDDQRASAFIKYVTESADALKKLTKTLDDFDLEHNSPERERENRKKLVEKNTEALRELGLADDHGNLTLGRLSGPAGTSPEQALRDARDNERRGLALYGVSASLSGVSDVGQITGMETLRKQYADKEYDALKRMADLKNDEQMKQDAIDQQHQKYLDAEIERQQALLQLALRQKEEFQNLATGLFESILHGGASGFLKQQGTGILDKLVGNAAGMAWGDVSKVIPHASGTMGKLLQGTMFGPDPLKAATDLNTQATIENTIALRARAMSPSGGGGSAGGFSSAASTWARLSGGGTDVPGYDPSNPDAITPEGAAWGEDWWAAHPGGGMSGLAKGAGVGAAALAGGFGIYSGVKAGGAQGALTAAGSAAGMAGGIVSMLVPKLASALGPIGMALGMGLGLVSTLLGDPKQKRADDLSTQAQARAFTMPSGADYDMASSGQYDDYNYRGQVRATVVNNVYAMDAVTFRDFLIANPDALSAGITSAIAGGNADDVVGSLAARSN